jgi:small subunit ribosomal protein S2
MLTNFETIRTRLKALENLDNKLNGSDVDKFTKKEKAKLQEEADKLHKMFDGIKDLKRVPDALFIVDVVKEKIAVVEAKKMGIPVIGIADTNANPELIDYPIPANDDARKTIEIITDLIVKSFQEGKKKFTTVKKENEKEEK